MTIDEALAIARRFRDEIPERDWETTLRVNPELRARLQAAVSTYFEFMRPYMNVLALLERL
jgi:hypothetical protein